MTNPVQKFKTLFLSFSFFLGFSLLQLSFANAQQESVSLRHVDELTVELKIGAGILNVGTHQQSEAAMRFSYSRDSWKPEVAIDSRHGQGRLSIRQPEVKDINMLDSEQNTWELKLPTDVPTLLDIRMGAGESSINLSGARLNRLKMQAGAGDFKLNLANTSVADLEVNAGVGSLTLDLRGQRNNNLQARINGGIGDLELLLPEEVGVRVKVSGLGDLDREGFTKQDGYYVNSAYGRTPYTINITVNGGLGSVKMAAQTGSY